MFWSSNHWRKKGRYRCFMSRRWRSISCHRIKTSNGYILATPVTLSEQFWLNFPFQKAHVYSTLNYQVPKTKGDDLKRKPGGYQVSGSNVSWPSSLPQSQKYTRGVGPKRCLTLQVPRCKNPPLFCRAPQEKKELWLDLQRHKFIHFAKKKVHNYFLQTPFTQVSSKSLSQKKQLLEL